MLANRRGMMAIAMATAAALTAMASPVRADNAPTTAPSTEATVAALQAEVASLHQEVNTLKQESGKNGVTVADQQAVADQVLHDADQHSKLIADAGVTGGWDDKRGFFLGSNDGNFIFHPGLLFQYRGVVDDARGGRANGNTVTQQGFEVARLKFFIDGNVFSPDLTYLFQWTNTNNGGAPMLEMGYVQYVAAKNIFMGGDLAVKAGQFRDPVFAEDKRESDSQSLAVDHSLADALVGGTAVVGPLIQAADVELVGKNTPIHLDVAFDDGDGSGNADFDNGRSSSPLISSGAIVTNWGALARGEFKVKGNWADDGNFTGKDAQSDLFIIGAGIGYSDISNADVLRGEVDGQYIIDGQWVFYGSLIGDNVDFRNNAFAGTSNDWGTVWQAGYFINPALQVFGRFDMTRLDDTAQDGYASNGAAGTRSLYEEVTTGANYFLGPAGSWGNRAKLTADVTYLPRGAPVGVTFLDFLPNTAGHCEVVFRAQVQLAF